MKDNCILAFLTDLKENNSRDWLLAHKDEQKKAAAEFEELLQSIIDELACSDPSIAHLRAKDLMFKMNRDTRFSHDKSPYNPAFRAHISPAGRVPIPVGYYMHITPGNIFLGGGLFASMFTDATRMVRNYLLENGEAFAAIVSEPAFQENFVLVGEKLKNVPKGFDPAFAQSEYLKHKSWALEYHMDDAALMDLDSFRETAVQKFLLMRPFNDYLNRALEDFKMPMR